MAYNEPAFIDYFDRHHVQLPLRKGDAVFFSPALFHGAGTNQSAHDRLANLVQISSAFGRPMESIDRYAMIEAVYPALVQYKKEVGFSQRTLDDTIAALADGYSFPTNLDSDPPIGGKAPETAQQMLAIALEQDWIPDRLKSALVAYAERRQG
jgi:ectoine hydroxylase-related dioxygenase (phytanoyl-CoA dioxygenase family)